MPPRGNRKKKTPKKERNDPKTRRTLWDAEILGNAPKEIENKTFSIRAASRAYGIPKTTLADYISGRCKLGPGRSLGKNPVFSHEVEEEMVRYSGVHIYAQILANLYYGMAREEMTSTPVKKKLEDKFHKNKIKQIKKEKTTERRLEKEVKKRLKTKSHVKIGNKKNKTENKSMNKKKHTTGTYPCGQCGGLWADENDPKKDEDFVACVTCKSNWYHESCAQDEGVFEDGGNFYCKNCV